MSEEHDDLMVLEEGQGPETPETCTCSTGVIKVR